MTLLFTARRKGDGGSANPHFHVMTTMRPLNPDGAWGQKQRREYLLDEDRSQINKPAIICLTLSIQRAGSAGNAGTLAAVEGGSINTKFEEKVVHITTVSMCGRGLT